MKVMADTTTRLSPEEHTVYRSCTMRACYLAQDRPDIQFACKELARSMQEPENLSVPREHSDCAPPGFLLQQTVVRCLRRAPSFPRAALPSTVLCEKVQEGRRGTVLSGYTAPEVL